MGSKYKISDAGNQDMQKRSCKVLPLSEKLSMCVCMNVCIKEDIIYVEIGTI